MVNTKNNPSKGKKYSVNNSMSYIFDWVLGDPDSNVLIENKKLNIRMNHYLIKNNKGQIEYDGLGIAEPKNNVVIVIINQNQEIGLIWEWRPIPEEYFWACVRGFSDTNDKDNIETAKREMLEEIGNFQIIKSEFIGLLYQNTTFYENPVNLVFFYVKNKDINELSIDEGIFGFEFFSKRIILNMVRNGEIKDTFTLSALMRYFSINS